MIIWIVIKTVLGSILGGIYDLTIGKLLKKWKERKLKNKLADTQGRYARKSASEAGLKKRIEVEAKNKDMTEKIDAALKELGEDPSDKEARHRIYKYLRDDGIDD